MLNAYVGRAGLAGTIIISHSGLLPLADSFRVELTNNGCTGHRSTDGVRIYKHSSAEQLDNIHPSLKQTPAPISKGSMQQQLIVEALREVIDSAKDLFEAGISYEVKFL